MIECGTPCKIFRFKHDYGTTVCPSQIVPADCLNQHKSMRRSINCLIEALLNISSRYIETAINNKNNINLYLYRINWSAYSEAAVNDSPVNIFCAQIHTMHRSSDSKM